MRGADQPARNLERDPVVGAEDGCVQRVRLSGIFHPDTGANDKITNRQTKAQTDMTRLPSVRGVAYHVERRQRSDQKGAQ